MRTSTLVAVTALIAVALFGLYEYGVKVGLASKVEDPREDTWVLLKLTNGKCVPSDPLQLRIARGKNVVWHVKNNDCEGSYSVSFRNFGLKDSTGGVTATPGVTDPDPAVTQSAITPGQSSVAIAKINAAVTPGEYKYEIWLSLNGATPVVGRDPDIDIWPY